jgi:hypothetical protein
MKFDDIWTFIDGPFSEALWPDPPPGPGAGYMDDFNRLVGAVRIRQYRVPNEIQKDCTQSSKPFSMTNATCFLNNVRDTKQFGGSAYAKNSVSFSSRAIRSTQDALTTWLRDTYSGLFYSKISRSYPGDHGYFVDLSPINSSLVKSTLANLKNSEWFDAGTRAIFFEYTFYNANVDSLVTNQLTIETIETGSVIPSSNFNTLRGALFYGATVDIMYLLECFFFSISAYLLIKELYEIRKTQKYIRDEWNIVDLLVALTLLIWSSCRLFSVYPAAGALCKESICKDPTYEKYIDFSQISLTNRVALDAISLGVMFNGFKLLKLLRNLPRVGPMIHASWSSVFSVKTIVFFMFMLIMAVVTGVALFLCFGNRMAMFKSPSRAFFTSLYMQLGDSYLEDMMMERYLPAIIFQVLTTLIGAIVLTNVFIAIVSNVYDEALETAEKEWDIKVNQLMVEENWYIVNQAEDPFIYAIDYLFYSIWTSTFFKKMRRLKVRMVHRFQNERTRGRGACCRTLSHYWKKMLNQSMAEQRWHKAPPNAKLLVRQSSTVGLRGETKEARMKDAYTIRTDLVDIKLKRGQTVVVVDEGLQDNFVKIWIVKPGTERGDPSEYTYMHTDVNCSVPMSLLLFDGDSTDFIYKFSKLKVMVSRFRRRFEKDKSKRGKVMKTEAKIRESFVFDHWTYAGAQAAHKEGKKTPMRPLLADMHTFALRPRDDEDEVFRRQKKEFKSEKRHIAQSTKLEKILEKVHAIEETTNKNI